MVHKKLGVPLHDNGKLARGANYVVGRLLKLIAVFPITTNVVVTCLITVGNISAV